MSSEHDPTKRKNSELSKARASLQQAITENRSKYAPRWRTFLYNRLLDLAPGIAASISPVDAARDTYKQLKEEQKQLPKPKKQPEAVSPKRKKKQEKVLLELLLDEVQPDDDQEVQEKEQRPVSKKREVNLPVLAPTASSEEKMPEDAGEEVGNEEGVPKPLMGGELYEAVSETSSIEEKPIVGIHINLSKGKTIDIGISHEKEVPPMENPEPFSHIRGYVYVTEQKEGSDPRVCRTGEIFEKTKEKDPNAPSGYGIVRDKMGAKGRMFEVVEFTNQEREDFIKKRAEEIGGKGGKLEKDFLALAENLEANPYLSPGNLGLKKLADRSRIIHHANGQFSEYALISANPRRRPGLALENTKTVGSMRVVYFVYKSEGKNIFVFDNKGFFTHEEYDKIYGSTARFKRKR